MVYRPPSRGQYAECYITRVVQCLAKYESAHTNIILGDLNLPKIDWASLSTAGDRVHSIFLRHVIESSYCQVVNFHTHDSNILDVVLTNDASMVHSVRAELPVGFSDHSSVKFELL